MEMELVMLVKLLMRQGPRTALNLVEQSVHQMRPAMEYGSTLLIATGVVMENAVLILPCG